MLKIKYYVCNDNMTDRELQNVKEREFIITEDMLQDLLEEKINLDKSNGEYIDQFYVNKI